MSPQSVASNRTRGLITGVALAVLAVVLVPSLPGIGAGLGLRTLTVAVIYSLAAASAGVLYGRLGLVSIMQVGLVAVGGWTTLRLHYATGLPFEVVLLLAALVTAVVGTVVSLPALRLSGLSLAITTLMIAGALEVIVRYTGFPNGGPGFVGRDATGSGSTMPRPSLGQDDQTYFRYVAVVVIVVLVLLWWLLASRPGRAWAAIRQGDAGAMASGINTTAYRVLALAVTSAVTGVAGALLAANSGVLDPVSFKAQQSVLLFATVLIAGAFSLAGAVIGGLFFYWVPQLLNTWGVDGNLVFVILGLGTVQAITTAPHGIAGQLENLSSALRSRTGRRVEES
ncbi:branched-chain amino acid ABC transporter permease [Micromonospora sp. KC606]|uniref:branched-chain amino acid ABC transporter permease n=1 Tax=Micromonospora sp. KC606 TaxID=2530379 RepID=UPI001044D165|nr:branched-chain amino acid ABC transporter permease [Micromonospora sp. KC606]TDC83813.1 branched-chain amino acid ABC transporter permease [Micromonospora sp. KC606]